MANREQGGVEQLIGPFLNTLALRFSLTEASTFTELVQQVNRTFLAGLDHQQVPFERVLQEVQDTRDPSRSPLFQVVFNFQADQSSAGTPGSQLQDLHNGGCDFDLLVNIVSGAHGMTAHIDYYADVHGESSVARFAAAYGELLRAAASNTDRPVAELPLVATRLPGPHRSRIRPRHGVRQGLPRARPRRTAGSARSGAGGPGRRRSGDHVREILARCTAVAAQLRQRVPRTSGAPVAICLPRSADMSSPILGVLRAGFSLHPA